MEEIYKNVKKHLNLVPNSLVNLFVQGTECHKGPNQGIYHLYWDLWFIMSTNLFVEISLAYLLG